MMEGAITALEKENRPAHTMWQPTAVCWKYGMTKLKHQGEILINKISGNKVSPLRQTR